jgi:hypothetical protein
MSGGELGHDELGSSRGSPEIQGPHSPLVTTARVMTFTRSAAIVLIGMPSQYVVTVKGEPGELLRAAFDDVDVQCAPGVTVLTAELDQPALHGLLTRIEDLGLELLDMRLVTDDS